MKKINIVLIISSIIILTNCSSNNDANKKELKEIEVIVTDEFLQFCDDFWDDDDYNPAKFEVKNKEFIGKWVVISGKISFIHESGVTIELKNEEGWFSRSLTLWFDFGSPEKVMDFKRDQEIKVKAKYDRVNKYEGILQSTYDFYFVNTRLITE